jgi:hypothetical protein
MLIEIRSSAVISSHDSHPRILKGRSYPARSATGRSDGKPTALRNPDDPGLDDDFSMLASAGAAATKPELRMKVRRVMLM